MHMRRENVTLSLDLSGDSLHKRGYRKEGGAAPLKENLAAAILMRAGWHDKARKGVPPVDPMCGSGTLLIEAAMMSFDMAPGLGRKHFGFLGWKGHDHFIWQKLLQEATDRVKNGSKSQFFGFDSNKQIIKQANVNAACVGLSEFIRFGCLDVSALKAPETHAPGMLITNPPYGERVGEKRRLKSVYGSLGDRLKEDFSGWQASVFTGNPDLAKYIGIRAKKQYKLFNGALSCKLLNFDVHESWFMHNRPPGRPLSEQSKKPVSGSDSEMFANRIRKNLKNLGKWARKAGVSCYRLYDADMPEYAVAIDIHNDWVQVQEYQSPAGVRPENARRRLNQIMYVLPEVTKTPVEKIILKLRKKTRGKEQYERRDTSGKFFEVQENGLRFLVNLTDYLDTGLFLDHRITRQLIKDYSAGKQVLNLFCYTAAATVYASAGGASHTKSVDMSHTYLSWAEKILCLMG